MAAAPLFSQIPAAALGGVLIGASIRILNPTKMKETLRTTQRELVVFYVTAAVTISVDLLWGIAAGLVVYLLERRMRDLNPR